MNKKIRRCFVIMLGLLLFTSSIVFAEDVNNVTIPELGTITLPAGIEVLETVKNGNKRFNFLMKDHNVFRTLGVFSKMMPNVKLEAIAAKPELIKSFVGTDRILRSDQLKSVVIGKKKGFKASLTSYTDYMAYNVTVYFIEKTDGVVMVMFMSADGDSPYWESVRKKIITDAN